MPGEKTLRQSDVDDDDDDDGGEYEGFDYSSRDEKSDRKKVQQCNRPDAAAPGEKPKYTHKCIRKTQLHQKYFSKKISKTKRNALLKNSITD